MSRLGILTAWNYAWSVLTACLVLGVAIYLLDRKFGVSIYRFGYDLSHKNPMPKEVERGFLYQQSTNRGVSVAVFLSTVYSLFMVWELGFAMDFIAELIVWLLMPPALVGGFWLGRWVYKVLLRRSVYLDKVDEFGQTIERMEMGNIAHSVQKQGVSILSSFTTRWWAPKPIITVVTPEPAPIEPEQPKESFRATMDRMKGKKDGRA